MTFVSSLYYLSSLSLSLSGLGEIRADSG